MNVCLSDSILSESVFVTQKTERRIFVFLERVGWGGETDRRETDGQKGQGLLLPPLRVRASAEQRRATASTAHVPADICGFFGPVSVSSSEFPRRGLSADEGARVQVLTSPTIVMLDVPERRND